MAGSNILTDKNQLSGTTPAIELTLPVFREGTILFMFLFLGVLLNITTWYHPLFLIPVMVVILGLLPLFLWIGIHRPYYLLLYIFVILFTQYTFPNNVTYETYFGYEKPTIYFHSFLGYLSVFDIVLLSSLYILIIRGLMLKKFGSPFSHRWEFYGIYGIVLIALLNGFSRQNPPKEILAEIQSMVYAGLLYFLVTLTLTDKKYLQKAVFFIAILLSITIPIEFNHYLWSNYHRLIFAVGRIVRPLVNSISDNIMIMPAFVFLCCASDPFWTNKKNIRYGAAIGAAVSLLVIFLNTGREIALLTGAGLLVFLLIRKFQLRVYINFLFFILLFVVVLSFLQPYHVQRLEQNFESSMKLFTDYRKDTSIWDRVAEFRNVTMTLKNTQAQWFGLGWAGKWDEYYFQPGRGSFAAYSDKTLTRHRQTHNIVSMLFVKTGYLGTAILLFSIISLFIHFCRVYRKIKDPQLKPIMLGLLITYPLYFFFSSIMQICMAFGIVVGFLRTIEKISIPSQPLEMNQH